MKKKLRVYQQKIVNVLKEMEIRNKENNGNFSTIIELPTGAGKTLTAINYIVSQALENQCKVLWLTHRDFLLKQAQKELKEQTGEKYKSIIVSGKSDNLSKINESTDVIFGSIFSMTAESILSNDGVRNWLTKPQDDGKRLYIIIDEAHHVGSNTYDSLLETLLVLPNEKNELPIKKYALVGLTATPFREDAEELRLMKWFKHGYEKEFKLDNVEDVDSAEAQEYLACDDKEFREIKSDIGENVKIEKKKVVGRNRSDFGNLIRVIELQDLIRSKVLIEPYFYRVDDFENDGINDLDGVSKSIVENIKNSNDLGKTVIFVPRTEMTDKIEKSLNACGIKCKSITAKNSGDFKVEDDRDIFDILKVDVITTVDVISEGFNVEELSTVILASGTTSRNRLRQRIGRVVRSVKDKDKKARVIWYYIADSKDERKVGTYLTNNQGYKKSADDEEDKNRQSDESVENDRKRKTYYLTAPKYSMPMGYALEYDSNAYKEYVDFLNILELFQDNEEINSFIGYYKLEDSFGFQSMILLDKVLLEGFQHLFRRVRSQWLILRDDKKYVDNITDFAGELGVSIPNYILDVMKVCFFLCKPKKNSVFYADPEIIKAFIDAILRNNGNEPELITLHKDVMDFVEQICAGVSDYDVSPEEILEEALKSNRAISIRNEEPKPIEVIYDEIFKDYGLSDDAKRDMILEGIKAHLADKEKRIKDEIKKICNDNNCESIGDVPFSSLLQGIIKDWKNHIIESYKNSGKSKKEHTKELRIDNYINYELEDLADEIKKYRTNWSDKPVTYDDNGVKRVFAWVDLDKSKSKLGNHYELENNVLRLPRRPAISSTMAICQSILINTHHLVVSKDDAEKYEEAIKSFVEALEVTIENKRYEDLARDIVCRLGYEMENVADRPYFKSLIEFFLSKEIQIPRFFAYLMYDVVYEAVWREVSFLRKDGVVSSYCQNEDDLKKISAKILKGYKLSTKFFDKYNLQPVADAIFDYRPYTKVLRSYLGIKPDLLCRMMNLIAKQAPECNHFITGCGGSAAGLINRFNPINDSITTETYNEYGFLLTNFYLVLRDKNKYKELLNKISLFIDLLCKCDVSTIKKGFTDSIYKYFSGNNNKWENDTEERFQSVFEAQNNVYDLGSIGAKTRNHDKNQGKDDELIKKFLHNNPAIYLHYLYKNEKNEELAFEDAKQDIQTCENVLHGVYRIYEQFYLWCRKAENDADIRNTKLNDIDLAFVVYLFYSFPGRYRFDDCHIASFVKFASSYEQNIEMGHERVKNWDIYNPPKDEKRDEKQDEKRDVNIVLQLPQYNKDTAIAYCDIPYAETNDSLYVDKTFEFNLFVNRLDSFKGKYIVSSRYNICTKIEFKYLYYCMSKELKRVEKDTLISGMIKSIETDNMFFTSQEKEMIIKELTSEDRDNYWKSILVKANECKNLVLKIFADNVIMSNKEDMQKVLGESLYDRKIRNILDFYQSFSNMTTNKPKYIVIPYTNAQEDLRDGQNGKKVRNNYRLTEDDVDIMFKNTIFSNIPVEVMITNVEMVKSNGVHKSEEKYLAETYKIGEDIYALPTVKADADSSNYLAEPIYLILTYDKYIEYMENNLLPDKEENPMDVADFFMGYLNSMKNPQS